MLQHLNPDGLNKNPAFTNVITVTGPAKTIYIGGQDAVDGEGNLIGAGDIRAQTEQVLKNIVLALKAADADLEHIVKWTIYVVQGHDFTPGFEVFQQVWGQRPNPPTVTLVTVAGLAHPHFIIEIDAVAVLPLA